MKIKHFEVKFYQGYQGPIDPDTQYIVYNFRS